MDPRRGKPHQEFSTTDANGNQVTFKADSSGLVRPKDALQQQVADSMDLPYARVTTDSSKDEAATPTTTAGPQKAAATAKPTATTTAGKPAGGGA